MIALAHLAMIALAAEEGGRTPEEWLQLGTQILARSAEVIGAIVIAAGVLRALARWLEQFLPRWGEPVTTENIRLGLGRSLGLALEFLLAADILSTAVAPTWDAIGKLAAVATIRTPAQLLPRAGIGERAAAGRTADAVNDAPRLYTGAESRQGHQIEDCANFLGRISEYYRAPCSYSANARRPSCPSWTAFAASFSG